MVKDTLSISNYLKNLSEIYKNSENKSFTEILESFKCISDEYKKFKDTSLNNIKYSSINYDECTEEEKSLFYDDQLQMIECLVINSIYDKVGMPWNWKYIYDLLHDENYSRVEKSNRKVVYATSGNNRPIGDISFSLWNGLQIIDLDIKNEEITNGLKPLIFNELNKYHWFLGICKSASGKGLHIWTKITPISVNPKNRKIEYLCNFRQKYSYVYIILSKYMSKFGYTKEKIYDYMDMAMAKPQQGIFISSDNNALMSTNFIDLRLDANFESAFQMGIESINWISHPELQSIFHKLEWFINEDFDKKTNVEISNLDNVQERDYSKDLGSKHYKHNQRWQLANTLVAIFGQDRALQIMIEICKGTDKRELMGDIKTASIHNKPISIWAVNELNKQHGFNIKLKEDTVYKDEKEKLINEAKSEIKSDKERELIDPIKVLNDKTQKITLHISSKQYLSDIKDDIIKNLSHITLLEAGAGYGKTEMIKSLKSKTLLILPFTSTIKAKVEASSVTKDWLYYYGNKRPTLDDLLGTYSMSMTIDKFSKLNVMELDEGGFEYIVIDESHLLFTSSYREVMSPCIQRLANCKAKIIMMTGTPTGELLFFPNIRHIKVIKEDLREKIFEVHKCPTENEQLVEMCKSMANDIIEGRKVLFPTNKGNLYFDQVTSLIQDYLLEKHWNNRLNAFYYKKSNYGEDSMDNININKSIGDNDIVFCTTYLSVGVDICDKYTFSVYFNEQWIPQDIEQFANRLRNNNLYIKMFLPNKNGEEMINYYYTQPLNLSFGESELLLARDFVIACNDMLERNNEEFKYNPITQNLLSANKFIKYDENECKYYIDETTYKLKVFEDKYSEFSKQLEIMLNGIRYYGYNVDIIEHTDEIPEANVEILHEKLKACRNEKYNQDTIKTFTFLNQISDNNIDTYKELLKGNYEVFKDEKLQFIRDENQIYAEDIEILEKNVPIVISLYRTYNCDTIKEIYEYCVDKKNNRINYSKLDRIRKFVSIENNRIKKRLDFPIIRFIKDSQKFANDNPELTKEQIVEYCANYAVKYANSIKNVVKEDNDFLESIYELICNLWKVIIIQSRPSNGIIKIKPFELLWENKQALQDIYGDFNTKEFFLQSLLDNMIENKDIEGEEDIPELTLTEKESLENVKNQLQNVIHSDYDYEVYSKLDNSNERFMRKQENTNQLRDTLFENMNNNDEVVNTTKQSTLFDECPF